MDEKKLRSLIDKGEGIKIDFKRELYLYYESCKKELAKNINEYLKPIREKRKYYEERPDVVHKILEEGTEKARKKALNTIKKVKKSMHINYFE